METLKASEYPNSASPARRSARAAMAGHSARLSGAEGQQVVASEMSVSALVAWFRYHSNLAQRYFRGAIVLERGLEGEAAGSYTSEEISKNCRAGLAALTRSIVDQFPLASANASAS